ncbi:MAG: hypothetical protein GY842_16015 [bacterium]|nr:hypothetical protein [bacterium]
MLNQRVCIIGLLAASGIACNSIAPPEEISGQVAVANSGNRDLDWAALDAGISEADSAMLVPHQADPGPTIDLLEEHVGDLYVTAYICERIDRLAAFCWTRASSLDAEHRDWICARMLEDIGADHEETCRAGFPMYLH